MKKVRLSVGFIALVGLALLNFTQSESCFVSKALASGGAVSCSGHASNVEKWESSWDSYNSDSTSGVGSGSSNSSSGDVIDHGNVADKRCPIWDVQVVFAYGKWAQACTSGGGYKCDPGTCPHGV